MFKSSFQKIDHLGIAVKSLKEALPLYSKLLGTGATHEETVPEQKVRAAFVPVGETNLELLEATSDDSPIARFIAKKGEGIHHICFAVENIEARLAECKKNGIELIDQKPRIGAHGKKIAFLHPKSTGGVLIELAEQPNKGVTK